MENAHGLVDGIEDSRRNERAVHFAAARIDDLRTLRLRVLIVMRKRKREKESSIYYPSQGRI